MEKRLLKRLGTKKPRFNPRPWFNRFGDCIVYKLTNEATFAERVDDVLTIYRSLKTKRSVGFQIKDATALAAKHKANMIHVDVEGTDNEVTRVSVVCFLLAAYERGKHTPARRQAYAELLSAPDLEGQAPIVGIQEAGKIAAFA